MDDNKKSYPRAWAIRIALFPGEHRPGVDRQVAQTAAAGGSKKPGHFNLLRFHICSVYITLFLGNKYMRPLPLKKTKLEPPFTRREGEQPAPPCALMSRHQAFPRGRALTTQSQSTPLGSNNTFDCVCTALIIGGASLPPAPHFSIIILTIPRPSITQQLPVYGTRARLRQHPSDHVLPPSTRGLAENSRQTTRLTFISSRFTICMSV